MINVYEFLRYQPELYKQFNCKDLMFVYYYCPQKVLKVDVFTHYNVLAFIIEGRKLIHRPEKSWLLEAGHCYFLRTGAYNQELHMGDNWRSMNLYIPDSYLQTISQEYKQVQHQASSAPPLEQINELAFNDVTQSLKQQMLDSFTEEPAPADEVLEQRFLALFRSILDDPGNQSLVAHLGKVAATNRPSLYAVMETNYTYNLSLNEFAQLAHQSLATFKREFKRIFNRPPAQWLLQRRLDCAEVLLRSTEKSIADIAAESGFESNAHFSRTFNQKFGVSPLSYRKQGAPTLIA